MTRYTTRKEIVAAIDKEKTLFTKYMEQAEKLDAQADELFKNPKGNHCLADGLRLDALKLRQKAYLKETIRIPRLARTLAAFDTAPLGLDGSMDRAVVLQS
jgi:hypothetical protein